jgi:hypothetical protein|nr:hypothetical protein [Bilophila wadsworthia]
MNVIEWLNELEKKADAATPGEWVVDSNFRGAVNCGKKHIALANYSNACDEESRVTNTGANADFIASANPETVKKLIGMVRELADSVGDPCYTCAWENEKREEECPKGCHVAMTLKKYGMPIPRNPEMEVFG